MRGDYSGCESRSPGRADAVQEASVRVESDSGTSRASNRSHWRLSGPMDSPSMAGSPVGCCPRPLYQKVILDKSRSEPLN